MGERRRRCRAVGERLAQHLEVDSEHKEHCNNDADSFTTVCRKEEGEEDDEHLYDTRYYDVVDVVVGFPFQVHCELDVDEGMGTASVLCGASLSFDGEELPFSGVDVRSVDVRFVFRDDVDF